MVDDRLLVLLNFSAGTAVCELPAGIAFAGRELLIGNYPVDAAEDIPRLSLRPYEARVYRLR
jgi:oligo-1,6-glucosidase